MNFHKFPITVFGVILGTGGLALASQSFLPFLTTLLTYLVAALFILFTGILTIKLIKHPGTVSSEIRHPIPGNFYALQPISAVILAILLRKEYPSLVDIGLLVYGGAMILALSVYLPYHFFSDMNVQFSDLHGGWFITPVATILITNAILLYPVSEASLIVSLLYFGIGTMLFLLVLSVLFFRLLSHNLPTSELAPTNFIMLAPIGILIVDILQISGVSGPFLGGANLVPIATLVGSCLWGFGVWVVLVNTLLLARYVKSGFPFHMGWWSYVFPTAAFTLGTVSLSKHLQLFGSASDILYVCLIAIWTVVSIGSLRSWVKSTLSTTRKVAAEVEVTKVSK
jgi:tellurite resistance protein